MGLLRGILGILTIAHVNFHVCLDEGTVLRTLRREMCKGILPRGSKYPIIRYLVLG